MNDQTVAFQCIYDIFTISDASLSENANILAELYSVDADELLTELLMFRATHAGKAFANFFGCCPICSLTVLSGRIPTYYIFCTNYSHSLIASDLSQL